MECDKSPTGRKFVLSPVGVVGFDCIAQLLSAGFKWTHLPSGARFTGFCIGMIGDFVFLGFYLQYIGVMLMYCNLLTAGFTIFAITMLHLQILQEEDYLTVTFGEKYLNYQRKVFRYLGRHKREKK